nr:prealbumin-like fold domain-containing protein [Bacilli bacterium]
MKKILIIFLLLFSFITVKADTNTMTVETDWINSVYYSYWYRDELHWGQMGYIKIDGKVSFCIDLDNLLSSTIYNISDESNIEENILLYGYFGYGYLKNNSLYDYLATQELIWETFGVNVKYTTLSEGNGNLIDVEEYKTRILNDIAEYNTNLRLDDFYDLNLGSVNNIINKTGIINNYIVVNNSNNIIEIKENMINITTYESGENTFTLKSSYVSRGENQVYVANNSQKLIYIGEIENKEQSYSYDVIRGTLSIDLFDINTQSKENSGKTTFKGNIFNLYDKYYKLIGTYETDESGYIIIDSLDIGEYSLEHLYTNETYNKLRTTYNFKIDSTNKDEQINVYLQPKYTEFYISKK